jgi:hypothetical protein
MTDSESRKTLYVLCQSGTIADARKAKLPVGAKLVDSIPLTRLTDECSVGVLYNGEGRKAIDCKAHWDGEGIVRSTFCTALGTAALPLVVRLRGDVLSLNWA